MQFTSKAWKAPYVLDGLVLKAAEDYWQPVQQELATLTAPEHAEAVIDLYESTYDGAEDSVSPYWSEDTARANGWIE